MSETFPQQGHTILHEELEPGPGDEANEAVGVDVAITDAAALHTSTTAVSVQYRVKGYQACAKDQERQCSCNFLKESLALWLHYTAALLSLTFLWTN